MEVYASVYVLVMLLLSLLAFPLIIIRLYLRKQRDYKKIQWLGMILNFINKIKVSGLLRGRVSLWYHEFYKIFITQKILLVLMIVAGLQIFLNQPKDHMVASVDDYFFRQYMQKLSGPLTEEKLQFIQSEKEKYEELNTTYLKFLSEGKSSFVLEQKLKPYQAFQWVQERLDYLKKNEGAYFIYDRPYQELTAGRNHKNDAILAFGYILLLILCVAGIFGMDYQMQLNHLCSITYRGKFQQVFIKIFYGFLLNLLLSLLVYIPFTFKIWNSYHMEQSTLEYPINSLPYLSHLGADITIAQYLRLVYICRILYAVIISLLIFYLAKKFRNTLIVIFISILIFALPISFLLVNEKFIDLYYFYSPILGNLLWRYDGKRILVLGIIYFFAAGVLLYNIFIERSKQA